MNRISGMESDIAKKAAGHCAASLVENGMVIGLGTGSTVLFFIEKLKQRMKEENLRIQVVSSSIRSEALAKEGNIPLLHLDTYVPIDLTVDGADQITPDKKMIKGGGGALVREKIVASSSKEMVVVIDETKRVDLFQNHPLPVEIISYYHTATAQKIKSLGYKGKMRPAKDGSLYLTDNGNHIFDITLDKPCMKPEEMHARLIDLPGVVDTGFFFGLAGRVIVGSSDGQTTIL